MVTALSRALMGRHYLGDVAAGLIVGFVTTAIITKVSDVKGGHDLQPSLSRHGKCNSWKLL
jgi:membrane-associated phospholipid phosphatase